MTANSKPVWTTITDLAKRVGRSRQSIHSAIGRGILPPPNNKGKYDLDACISALKNEEQQKLGSTKQQESIKLLDARRKLRACEKAELELATMRGEVIPVADVVIEISRMIQQAKTLLLSLPSQLSATVVGLSPAQAEREIRDAVLRALEQLSTEPWEAGRN